MKRLSSLLVMAAVCTVGCKSGDSMQAGAGGATSSGPAPTEVALKLDPKLNTPYLFTTEVVNKSTGSTNNQINESFDLTVTETAKDGDTLHFTQNFGNATVTSPDNSMPAAQLDQVKSILSGMVIDIEAATDGHLTKSEVKSDNPLAKMVGSAMQASSSGFMGTILPKDKVKVGTTWTSDIDFGAMLEAMAAGLFKKSDQKLPVTFKVEKIESVGGKTIVTISQKVNSDATMEIAQGSMAPMKMHMTVDGESQIDAADGLPVKVTSHSINHIEGPVKTDQDITNTVTRK